MMAADIVHVYVLTDHTLFLPFRYEMLTMKSRCLCPQWRKEGATCSSSEGESFQ